MLSLLISFCVPIEASALLRAYQHSDVICSGRRSAEGPVVIFVTQPANISTAILLTGSLKPRAPGSLKPVPGHSLQPGGHQTAAPTLPLKEGSTQAPVEPHHSKPAWRSAADSSQWPRSRQFTGSLGPACSSWWAKQRLQCFLQRAALTIQWPGSR